MRGNGSATVAIDKAHDPGAINRSGNGLTKARITKPLLLARYFGQAAFSIVIQVEHQEVVFKTRSGVIELEVPQFLLRLQHGKIVRAEPADNLGIARLKADHLC